MQVRERENISRVPPYVGHRGANLDKWTHLSDDG
jgi:hypothetical protein